MPKPISYITEDLKAYQRDYIQVRSDSEYERKVLEVEQKNLENLRKPKIEGDKILIELGYVTPAMRIKWRRLI